MVASAGLENVIDGVNRQVKNGKDDLRLECSEGFCNPLEYCFGGVWK